jgi:glycerophosphoryl diester phosphodiesterase
MTKIIGHRGARGLAAENTLAAIQKGIAAGAEEIEIDVRVTKDGVPVLIHDAFVRANDGTKLQVAAHPLATLMRAKPDLATLEAALRAIDNHELTVEVKAKVAIAPIVAVLMAFLAKNEPNSLSLASKSQRTLLALHRALPQLPCVVIERFSSVRAIRRARQVGTRRLSMNQHFLWFGAVSALHHRGYELNAYTLNNPAKAARWSRRGLAGVITDYPERFMGRLKES